MELAPHIEAFIDAQRVARLATVDPEGRPHVVPICFVYAASLPMPRVSTRGNLGALYSVLDAKPKRVPVERLRRVRNLLANPNVQVLLDLYDEDWSRLAYVQLRGLATLLTSGPEHLASIHLLREKYVAYKSMSIDDQPVIQVEIESAITWGNFEH